MRDVDLTGYNPSSNPMVMDTVIKQIDVSIKDYSDALKNFIEVSHRETKVKLLVQNARARLQKAEEEVRAVKQELLEYSRD